MIQVQTDHNLSASVPIICMHRQCQKRCPLMVSNREPTNNNFYEDFIKNFDENFDFP